MNFAGLEATRIAGDARDDFRRVWGEPISLWEAFSDRWAWMSEARSRRQITAMSPARMRLSLTAQPACGLLTGGICTSEVGGSSFWD
jgi:hypothetical protein